MANATTTPRPIDTVLDGDDPIDVGYEAATPWLHSHCGPEGEVPRQLATREFSLRPEWLA